MNAKIQNHYLKFLIVDDHPFYRKGIYDCILQKFSGAVIFEAANGTEALLAVKDNVPDIVLLDIRLPDMSGIELCRQLLQAAPMAKVIGLSAYDDAQHVFDMLSAGAYGYLNKDIDMDEFYFAITEALRNKKYVSCIEGSITVTAKRNALRAMDIKEAITAREKEILLLICKQLSNKEIALKLHLSAKTIENHRNNLLHKIGVHNTAGLVMYAVKLNWI